MMPRFSEHGSEHGIVLVTALAVLLGLMLIGLGAGTMLKNDFRISANLRESMEAFYYSGAGVEWAKRELARNQSFPPILPSRTASFASGTFVVSFHSIAVVGPLSARVVVRSVGTRAPARHLIEAQLLKTFDLADAALALRGNGRAVDFNVGTFVSGADHDAGGVRIANATPRSAVSVDSANLQSILSQAIESHPGALDTGPGMQALGQTDYLSSSFVSQLVDELCASPQAAVHSIPTTGALTIENQAWGTHGAAQLHCFEGRPEGGDSVTIAGNGSGAGILVVKNADLVVSGAFRWDGLVVVTGSDVAVRFLDDGTKQLFGAAVINETGNPGNERKIVEVEGAVRIAFSRWALGIAVPLIPVATLPAARGALPPIIRQNYWRADLG